MSDKNVTSYLSLFNGVLHRKIASKESINEFHNSGSRPQKYQDTLHKHHFIPETEFAKNSPTISVESFSEVDFIILDGGEYTSEGDMEILQQFSPSYIALDDVNCYKNYVSHRRLEASHNAQKIIAGKDRGGWSIFKLSY